MPIKKIQNFAFSNELWQKGNKLIVAVSGGADSSCLLHVLSVLAPKYGLSLHIAHVNYGLRGAASQRDERFVQKLAQKYNLPITVFSFIKAANRKYSEEELRRERYAFFEQLRADLGFDLIAVAHNQDDQAETVLLRLLRGAGLSGLAAMKARNGNIVRPLLVLNRKRILRYLSENGLEFRTDKTNNETVFTRNKVRLELLPSLEKNFNPKIKENLSDLSFLLADDYDYLSQAAAAHLKFLQTDRGLSFETAWLLGLHPALQRNCLRLLIVELKGDLIGIENKHVEEILKIVRSQKNKTQKTSFQGLNISRKGAKVYMARS